MSAEIRVKLDGQTERDRLPGPHRFVGERITRVDGIAKVTGQARYSYEGNDEGVAYGFAVTATIARGRVTRVHDEVARAMPGVLDILLDDPDLPSDAANGIEGLELPRGSHDIGYYGQIVGIVVAESFEVARAAAQSVQLEYFQLEGRYTLASVVETARHAGARAETPLISLGDLDAAIATAAHSVDWTYVTPRYHAAAMEPHATTVRWLGDRLEVRSALQILATAKRLIAGSLRIDPSFVRVLAPFIGGGFGGKTAVGAEVIMAAISSRRLGRPVKIALTRRQLAHLVFTRADTQQRVRLACDTAGHLTGIGHECVVTQREGKGYIEDPNMSSAALYQCPVRRHSTSVVRVDLPSTSTVRAPGEAVGSLAIETAMDEMAERLAMDPIAFRRLNEPQRDVARDRPFSTRRLLECYEEGATRFGWHERDARIGARRTGEWLIGMGMAAASRRNKMIGGQARVRITPEGYAVIETDMTDVGTGSYTVFGQIVADLLGMPMRRVTVRLGDTDLPPSAGSSGSYGAASTGSAIALACEAIRRDIERRMGIVGGTLRFDEDAVALGDRSARLSDVLLTGKLEATGTIEGGAADTQFTQAAYGAQFAEVAVSSVTGEVRVRRMLGVFECGRVLNATTARSQAIGGMIWGLSYALHEDAVVDDRTGAFVTRDLAEYHVPVHADIPSIEAFFLDAIDLVANPIGIKGLGELGISGSGAAVLNAIYNACGVRTLRFPLTLDVILRGLELASRIKSAR